ncbi:exportin-7 isoform X2 isoform A [Micractinium conductrix]|uniref:Exportin-7 isoform X2 isoform A n=1 Tax=Micractinium conductrix TaxID=554055 RepID=A0A2P6VEZ3_9CHLO|nr:exportin-7 isoform X2 isoform A [Micractinium conductrix]|eukprot:PSC72660.1 exportin-7 isoform X2 isoform A [Micractinium conductrix]
MAMPDIVGQLPQLEAMCERLYVSQVPQERAQAEQMLRVFGTSTEYVSHCKAILDNSTSPYAQLLASSSLIKIVTEHSLAPQVKLEMRSYFLAWMDSRGSGLEPFVATSLIQLLCRMTKLGWFEDDAYRGLADEARNFLEKGTTGGSQAHYLLGLRILNMLVSEMNSPTAGRSLTQHRKIAVNFRDQSLYKVFQLALTALRHLHGTAADEKLKEQAVQLALQCLSFDFVGTCLDESSEDLGTIQVPSAWRPSVEDPSTLQLFIDFYIATQPPLSNMALECLVRLASVRRSLFSSETERSNFLSRLVNGTRDLLRQQRGLAHHANYHEFCRLLGRLKANYQLSELVGLESYKEWIQLVAEFTISSLNSWQWASGSVYYLLGLWSRLVSSMPYLKGDAPSQLDVFVPKITRAYITSRLESVQAVVVQGAAEDPLDNDEQLQDQLDSLPYLCRFQYSETAEYLTSLTDPLIAAYQSFGTSAAGQDLTQLAMLEGQLTWLVHIIGAVVRGRMNTTDAQETMDGDLAARVFGLLRLVDTGYHTTRYGEHSRQRLDLALLSFFQNFRKVYVGEQVMHSSKVYLKLNERLGLSDHSMVLNIMLSKIATNLKVFGSCEDVVEQTLTLFQDLAAGYMSGKLLLKLDAIAFLLTHHTSDYFPFLTDASNLRNRTTFYHTLARLLFMEDTPAKFKSFVAPLQQVLAGLASASANASNAAALRSTVPRETVIGLFRDLRGIATATNSRRTYSMLFEWLYPSHFPTMLACLEAWADTPEVTTALLKFMAEFVLNKTQRLTFDSSSPNGILLFREVSKVIVTYGNRALQLGPTSDPYGQKYKGIWNCLAILTRALGGNYVNFGVFELYGDPALKDALDMALKLALSIPLADILAYRKVGKAYFALLDVLCHNHANVIATRDTATFAFLLSSLDAGLKSLDVSISSQCAAAVDNLAGYYFKHQPGSESPTPAAAAIAERLRQRPELFPQVLSTLFEIVLFEDCTNQWSLSRPMLSLILISEPLYAQLKQQIVASQMPDRQQHLAACLEKLMLEVQRNLEPKNRDKFTQNLTIEPVANKRPKLVWDKSDEGDGHLPGPISNLPPRGASRMSVGGGEGELEQEPAAHDPDAKRTVADTADAEEMLPDNPMGLDEEIITDIKPFIADLYDDTVGVLRKHGPTFEASAATFVALWELKENKRSFKELGLLIQLANPY